MKIVTIIFLMISFIAYSQSMELRKDKNDRKFILEKNNAGGIINVTPLSGVDYQSEFGSVKLPNSALKTTAHSFSWQSMLSAPGFVLKDISFATPLVGFIVSELGVIYKTTDGGNTWIQIQNLGFPYYWYGVDALTPDTIVISGFNDQASQSSGVVRWSYNGGTTWTDDIILTVPGNGNVGWLWNVHFWNKNVGVVCAAWNGVVYYTTYGGGNWSSWQYVQVDPANGWYYGHLETDLTGNVWTAGISQAHSSDFGKTWTSYPHVDPVFDGGVDFTSWDNNMTGLTGGGEISPNLLGWLHKTTDGGQTWSQTLQSFPFPIRSVKVFTSSLFLAMGGNVGSNVGGIYSSTNGGTIWNLEQNTTAEMTNYTLSYPSADSTSIWCVGASGQGNVFVGKVFKTSVPNTVLPVELTTFTANSDLNNVVLNWSTATEINNKGFEIQRSNGSQQFISIGFVEGKGTTTEVHNYSFTDSKLEQGKYSYRLKQIDLNGNVSISNEVNVTIFSPNMFSLEQNYPNPFNPTTIIQYSLPSDCNVKMTVVNSLGEVVREVINSSQNSGMHTVNLDASGLASGIYFYNIKANSLNGNMNYTATKKMIVIK